MSKINHVYLSNNLFAANTVGDCEITSENDVYKYLVRHGSHGEYVFVRYYYGESRSSHEIPHEYTFRAWYNDNCRDPKDGGVAWELSQMDNARRLWDKICHDVSREDFGVAVDDTRQRLISLGYNAEFVLSLSDAQIARAGEIDDAADLDDYLNPGGRMA